MMSTSRTLPETVGWVRQEGLSLNLPTDRLAFLIAIKTLSEDESDLSEAALHDAFGYVSSAFGQMDETLIGRANNAINDLIRQQLLSRFTTDMVAGESLYRLSRLGMSIVDFFMDQRQVDSIKLSILLEHLASELDTARKAALETNTREQWDAEVLPRLSFSLEETLGRIDLTQRAMDEQQNQVKSEIAALLTQNWVDAIHSCEKLLHETGQTLRELQDKLKAKAYPWEVAKSFDGACVLAPFVPGDALEDLTDLGIRLSLNGELRQDGNSRDMLNPILPLIQHICGHFSLQAGDVILTGTPVGVGPLSAGDMLELELVGHSRFSTRVL